MSRLEAVLSVERFLDFSLLGLAAAGFFAIAGSGYLDVPTVAFTVGVLALRAFVLADLIPLRISNRGITIACLCSGLLFAADYAFYSHKLVDAAAHLLFLLAGLQILSVTNRRDRVFLAFISFVELVAGAVLSVSLNFIIALALYLLFAMAALTSGEIRRSMDRAGIRARSGNRGFHGRLAVTAVAITAGILVLTAGLFFVLPRTTEAALARFMPRRIFVPGFSTRITLGQTGRLVLNDRPVMHIASPRPERLAGVKWRGDALTYFDGRAWVNPSPHWASIGETVRNAERAPYQQRPPGRYVNYEVKLDIDGAKALFMAGSPQVVTMSYEELESDETGGFRLPDHIPEGFQYSVYSLLEEPPESDFPVFETAVLSPESRARNLELPRLDPRIPELARALTAGDATDVAKARDIERHLRSDYSYTLEMPAREPKDPLADFLFQRKRGYCEYFASAMAVMLRSLGVPARIATGFENGVFNSLTGQWVVRAADAHAWVEAWMPGRGWTTFDPTPSAAASAGMGWMGKLNLYMDAAAAFWQEWVVGYDPHRQGTLAGRLQTSAGYLGFGWVAGAWDWMQGGLHVAVPWVNRRGVWLAAFLTLLLLVKLLGPWALHAARTTISEARARRGRVSARDATLLYRRMLRAAKRRGYQKPPWFTAAEFAGSLPNDAFGGAVNEFTVAYNALRFGGVAGEDEGVRLSALLEQVEHAGR